MQKEIIQLIGILALFTQALELVLQRQACRNCSG